ncbi:MAG TPA: M1 family metallopeptidase [Acidimicrobiia bacterium]
MRRALAALAALTMLGAGAAACTDDEGRARPVGDQGAGAPNLPAPDRDVGPAGLGDPYFPTLGNAGYDVGHYTLELEYDPETDVLAGTATAEARATAPLESFNLDLAGMEVESVTVDDEPAEFDREGEELVITPAAGIAEGDTFTTTVDYGGDPEAAVADSLGIEVGWIETPDGAYVLNEPDGAHTWYPVNDHPSDKASYTFRLTVPEPLVAAANGVLTDRTTAGGTTTYVWEAEAPMASYLVEVAVGDFVIEDEGKAGEVTIRHVLARELAEEATAAAEDTAEMVEFFAGRWGPYPFDAYGILVVDVALGVALESQTLSLFGADTCCFPGADAIFAHELAHQWFGNAVTPRRWRDIWLNEGFATYAEWMWAEHADGVPISRSAERVYDDAGAAGQSRPILDPGPEGLFDGPVYDRGGLTLYALRVEVGDAVFDDIVRTYFERFDGTSVTTQDFVDVAEEVSGRDLEPLFRAWLTEVALPPFPEAPPAAS